MIFSPCKCAVISFTVTVAARFLPELVHRVRTRGEKAMLLSDGEPVACVVPAGKTCTGAELAAAWAEVPHLGTEEAATFEADLAASRTGMRALTSPWD